MEVNLTDPQEFIYEPKIKFLAPNNQDFCQKCDKFISNQELRVQLKDNFHVFANYSQVQHIQCFELPIQQFIRSKNVQYKGLNEQQKKQADQYINDYNKQFSFNLDNPLSKAFQDRSVHRFQFTFRHEKLCKQSYETSIKLILMMLPLKDLINVSQVSKQ